MIWEKMQVIKTVIQIEESVSVYTVVHTGILSAGCGAGLGSRDCVPEGLGSLWLDTGSDLPGACSPPPYYLSTE